MALIRSVVPVLLLFCAACAETAPSFVAWPDHGGHGVLLQRSEDGLLRVGAGPWSFGDRPRFDTAVGEETILVSWPPGTLAQLDPRITNELPVAIELESETCTGGRLRENAQVRFAAPSETALHRLEVDGFEAFDDPDLIASISVVMKIEDEACLPPATLEGVVDPSGHALENYLEWNGQTHDWENGGGEHQLYDYIDAVRLDDGRTLVTTTRALYFVGPGRAVDLDALWSVRAALPVREGAWTVSNAALDPTTRTSTAPRITVSVGRFRDATPVGGGLVHLRVHASGLVLERFEDTEQANNTVVYADDGTFCAVTSGGRALVGRDAEVLAEHVISQGSNLETVRATSDPDRPFVLFVDTAGLLGGIDGFESMGAITNVFNAVRSAAVRPREGDLEIWVAIYGGALHKRSRGVWSKIPVRLPPAAEACGGERDECGWRLLSPYSSDIAFSPRGTLLLASGACSTMFELDPASECTQVIAPPGVSKAEHAEARKFKFIETDNGHTLALGERSYLFEVSVP